MKPFTASDVEHARKDIDKVKSLIAKRGLVVVSILHDKGSTSMEKALNALLGQMDAFAHLEVAHKFRDAVAESVAHCGGDPEIVELALHDVLVDHCTTGMEPQHMGNHLWRAMLTTAVANTVRELERRQTETGDELADLLRKIFSKPRKPGAPTTPEVGESLDEIRKIFSKPRPVTVKREDGGSLEEVSKRIDSIVETLHGLSDKDLPIAAEAALRDKFPGAKVKPIHDAGGLGFEVTLPDEVRHVHGPVCNTEEPDVARRAREQAADSAGLDGGAGTRPFVDDVNPAQRTPRPFGRGPVR